MQTHVKPLSPASLDEAAAIIQSGGLVAFPTETVYGLGANALDAQAVRAIFAAKGRPGDNPLIVHVPDIDAIAPLTRAAMNPAALALAEAYWPGPMTLILPKSELIPDAVSAGLDTVGIRIPSHEGARAFLKACQRPIAAPSANRSGRPSPTTAAHVLDDMDGRVPLILDGGPCQVGLESTVIDVTGEIPRVLRPGGVTPEMIAAVCGAVEVDGAVMRPLQEGEKPRSPGMKYRHYAPNGSVTIYEGEKDAVAAAIKAAYDAAGDGAWILALEPHTALYENRRLLKLGSNEASAAAALFDALRRLDDLGATAIFAESVPAEGLGLAVMNRLGRAAAFHIVHV